MYGAQYIDVLVQYGVPATYLQSMHCVPCTEYRLPSTNVLLTQYRVSCGYRAYRANCVLRDGTNLEQLDKFNNERMGGWAEARSQKLEARSQKPEGPCTGACTVPCTVACTLHRHLFQERAQHLHNRLLNRVKETAPSHASSGQPTGQAHKPTSPQAHKPPRSNNTIQAGRRRPASDCAWVC